MVSGSVYGNVLCCTFNNTNETERQRTTRPTVNNRGRGRQNRHQCSDRKSYNSQHEQGMDRNTHTQGTDGTPDDANRIGTVLLILSNLSWLLHSLLSSMAYFTTVADTALQFQLSLSGADNLRLITIITVGSECEYMRGWTRIYSKLGVITICPV